jgi:hypothetical protein
MPVTTPIASVSTQVAPVAAHIVAISTQVGTFGARRLVIAGLDVSGQLAAILCPLMRVGTQVAPVAAHIVAISTQVAPVVVDVVTVVAHIGALCAAVKGSSSFSCEGTGRRQRGNDQGERGGQQGLGHGALLAVAGSMASERVGLDRVDAPAIGNSSAAAKP